MSYDFTKIPLDRIDRVGQITMLRNNMFTVSWLLGRYCNFKCSYCWTHGRADKPDHRPTELCLKTIDSIKEQARARGFNSFHFSLSGGEPTLHPGYLDILDHLEKDINYTDYTSIHMTTNLSKSVSWFDKYLERAKQFNRASITASYHAEYMKDIEKFAFKLLYLQANGIKITINMVMVPERFDSLYDVALFFYNKGLNTTLKPQSDAHANYVVKGYTQDQLDILHNGMPQLDNKQPLMQVELVDDTRKSWYMDQAERFNAFNFNRFKGWECSSGYRSIIIREPCGNIKRSYSCSDEPMGNIETGFKLFDTVKECISPSCVSSADSKIPKRKKGTEMALWNTDENKQLQIRNIKFEEILPVWRDHLWKGRKTPIRPTNGLTLLGEFDKEVEKNSPTFFGAFVDGKCVGVNSGHKTNDDEYRSRGLYIFPEYRKKGISQLLLKAVEEECRKKGGTILWSMPRESALPSYKKFGFTIASDFFDDMEFGPNCFVVKALC